MEFEDVVRQRRMVRHYQDRAVPSDKLLRILEMARRGPSAGFSQGQRFVVVTGEATRGQIARIADEEAYVARGFDPWLSSAPVHIVVCLDDGAYRRRYQAPDKERSDPHGWPIPYPVVDAGAALMLLLLAAVNEGLAAGFLGVHRLEGVRELLGLPPDVVPIGLVTVGFPAADRGSESVRRGREPLEEIVHWEGWIDEP